jgi:hypothetical protein
LSLLHRDPPDTISNPKDYNDNEDARVFDKRLRGPIRPVELEIDPSTGMKNYIANSRGDWATSAAFVRYSFERSIHHGRLYTNGHSFFKGKDEDLAEALRCLGQGLHTLEDFGAHTNYVELSLRELGFHDVFAHTGTNTMINLRGKHTYPLVTGTFGMVDFYHSVLGEATDHFTQSEVNEMDNALGTAQTAAQSSHPVITLVKLLSKVPGTRDLCVQAEQLQRASEIQARENSRAIVSGQQQWSGNRDAGSYPGSQGHGAQDHSRVSQPDWSGLEVVNPQEQSDFNQHSGWNQTQHTDWSQQQQPGYGQQQPQWSQHQQQRPPSHGQDHSPNFNEQQASMAAFQFSNTTSSSFSQPPNYDGSHDQTWSQQSGDNFGQQASNFSQQQDFSQQQNQSFSHDGPAVNIQTTPSKPHETPSAPPMGLPGLPGLPDFDPAKTIAQIYPILAFRDKVVRTISAVIEKIPGLEELVEKITETLTVFILSLLAPFVRPVIEALTKTLRTGSSGVIESSAKQQFGPWTDPNCSDPTHSMLSKDHFSNILNPPAGTVAAEILKYVAPRVLYAWQNASVPVDHVLDDCMNVFHHPAVRDNSVEVHKSMFDAVKRWVDSLPDRGRSLNDVLGSHGVHSGKNQKAGTGNEGHAHKPPPSFGNMGLPGAGFGGAGGFQPQPGQSAWGGHQGNNSGIGGFNPLAQLSSLPIPGLQDVSSQISKFSSFIPGGFGGGTNRGFDGEDGRSRGLESQNEEMTREEMVREEDHGSQNFGPPSGYERYEGRSRKGSYQPSGDTQNYYGSQYGGGRSDDY